MSSFRIAGNTMDLNRNCRTHFASEAFVDTIAVTAPPTPSIITSPIIASHLTGSPASSPEPNHLNAKHRRFSSGRRVGGSTCSEHEESSSPCSVFGVESSSSELYPDHFPLTNSNIHPKKKARHSLKIDHEPTDNVIFWDAGPWSPPDVVAIPPARASDFSLNHVETSFHKGAAVANSKTSKKTTLPRPQPVRFCFVSVQHGAQQDGEIELTERIEECPSSFEHGPSELPPRPYFGGEFAASPLHRVPDKPKIPASMLASLPILEARFARLEHAIERYVDMRAEQALRNSILPELLPAHHLLKRTPNDIG